MQRDTIIYTATLPKYATSSDASAEPKLHVSACNGTHLIWLEGIEGDYIIAAHKSHTHALEEAILIHRLRSTRDLVQHAIQIQ